MNGPLGVILAGQPAAGGGTGAMMLGGRCLLDRAADRLGGGQLRAPLARPAEPAPAMVACGRAAGLGNARLPKPDAARARTQNKSLQAWTHRGRSLWRARSGCCRRSWAEMRAGSGKGPGDFSRRLHDLR